MPKRVLCLMDLSIVGRASLACVPAVLAACGVQCCPFPASLLSTHTGGFEGVQIMDLSEFGLQALSHIVHENTHFDAIYIGYLNSPSQFCLAEKVLECYNESYLVVDPALGDDGALYAGITKESVQSMRKLCHKADLITPNVTESALMMSKDPATQTGEDVQESVRTFAKNGVSTLVTSVPKTKEEFVILGCEKGEKELFCLPIDRKNGNYPGTGDLFTSAVVGLVLQGLSLKEAAQTAADFIAKALGNTKGGAVRQGIWFEPFLSCLSGAVFKERAHE